MPHPLRFSPPSGKHPARAQAGLANGIGTAFHSSNLPFNFRSSIATRPPSFWMAVNSITLTSVISDDGVMTRAPDAPGEASLSHAAKDARFVRVCQSKRRLAVANKTEF
jgi:hypothetical protein